EPDVILGHARQAHALARAIEKRRHACALIGHTLDRKVLLLSGNPVRRVQLRERLAFADRIERRARVESLDVAVGARLYDSDITFVECDAAHRFHARRHHVATDLGRSYAKVLLHTRADRDAAFIAPAAGV